MIRPPLPISHPAMTLVSRHEVEVPKESVSGWRLFWTKGLVCLTFLVPAISMAQVSDYDPEYDEMAAGTLGNAVSEGSDTVAPEAASPDVSSGDSSAVEAEVGGSAEITEEETAAGFGTDSEAAKAKEADPSSTEKPLPWEWGGERHFSTLAGPSGLFYIVDATSDDMGTFAIGFHGWFFKYKSYLYLNDENTAMWSGLTLRVTPWDYIEVFAGLDSRANSNNKIEPELFQTLGDFHIGLKGFYPVLDFLSVGLFFALEFKNPVGEVNFSGKGTNVPLGVLASFDISKFNENVPIKTHLNFIYRFDNSAKLVRDLENERGGCGEDINGDGIPNYGGCLNAVERTALEIDRLDQFLIGIGVEGTLPYVSPLLEYNLEIPVNRQDFVCPRSGENRNAESCMEQEGIIGMRQWLTLGVRVLPPLKTLSIDFGVDIGLTGYAPSVHELAAQAPYRIIFGLTYNYDPFAETSAPSPTPAPCPSSVSAPVSTREVVIVGSVRDADTSAPLSGASVYYRDQGVNPQMTGGDGKFVSYPFGPGDVAVGIAMEGYEKGVFQVTIPDPNDSEAARDSATTAEGRIEIPLDCPLSRSRDQEQAELTVRVASENGDPLPGVLVKISGADQQQGQTDNSGEYAFKGRPGTYSVVASKEGYFEKNRSVTLSANQAASLAIQMPKKPKEPSVELSKERITIKKKIMFATGEGEIDPRSYSLLDEVVEVIRTHPEIQLVEIQGHTDNRGKRKVNIDLSQKRADAVRQYLVNEGIDGGRLRAKGYGSLRPRAPNITSSGRARNRRVEFHIVENTP